MDRAIPLVSIITPSFNQGRFIEETILSIQEQTYKNIEHLIIDGGSTDQTLKILKKYSSSLSWISEPDTGQTDAINKGIIRSKGDIIAYLNSDDLYLPESIKTVVDYFTNHPDVDMVYGDIIHIDEKSQVMETVRTGSILPEDFLTCQVYLPQPAVFFRKRIIDKIGYFDESLHLAMDMEYWIRALLAVPTAYIPQPLAKARFYADTKSSAGYLKNFYEWQYIIDKTFSDEGLVLGYFKTVEQVRDVKTKAYSYVHFFGGLRFLHYREVRMGLPHIIKGIKLNPRLLSSPHLYWSLFVAVIGIRFSNSVIKFLPRIKKV
jgi:glycosyltransferase involved in cell wall biosynthesis